MPPHRRFYAPVTDPTGGMGHPSGPAVDDYRGRQPAGRWSGRVWVVAATGVGAGCSIGLTVAYGVLGALFMPFVALTLLGLLSGWRIPMEMGQRLVARRGAAVTTPIFLVMGVNQR